MFSKKLIGMSLAFWLAMLQGAISIGKFFFFNSNFFAIFSQFLSIPCWLITVFGIAPYLALSWEEFHYIAGINLKVGPL